jgi:hypothetical protein
VYDELVRKWGAPRSRPTSIPGLDRCAPHVAIMNPDEVPFRLKASFTSTTAQGGSTRGIRTQKAASGGSLAPTKTTTARRRRKRETTDGTFLAPRGERRRPPNIGDRLAQLRAADPAQRFSRLLRHHQQTGKSLRLSTASSRANSARRKTPRPTPIRSNPPRISPEVVTATCGAQPLGGKGGGAPKAALNLWAKGSPTNRISCAISSST